MSLNMSPLLFLLGLFLLCHQAFALMNRIINHRGFKQEVIERYCSKILNVGFATMAKRQHVSSRSLAGQKIDYNFQMDGGVLEIEFKKPENASDKFRETTSRYFFNRHLVAHKDKQAGRCYLQRTTLTRAEVERRINSVNQNATNTLGVGKEWINPTKAIPINRQLLSDMFGSEVTEFCRFEDVLYLGEGSYGTHVAQSPPAGLRRPGLRSRRRAAPGDVTIIIVETEDSITIYVIFE